MELSEIDYTRIQSIVDIKAREIFVNIFNEYFKYIKDDKSKVADLLDKNKMELDNDNNLVSVGRIAIVDRPNKEEDERIFGDKVPAGHGGRSKKDNMIHLYPYSPELLNLTTNLDDIISLLINEIVEHEIFHFYVKTDLYSGIEEESDVDKKFKDKLTEGIIQYLTNKYMAKYNLGKPKTGYFQELSLVMDIVKDLQLQNYTEEQIMYFLFNDNYKELINRCKNGQSIKNNYLERQFLLEYIIDKLKNMFSYDKKIFDNFRKKFKSITNVEEMYNQYVELISIYGFDTDYLIEIDSIFNINKEEIKSK